MRDPNRVQLEHVAHALGPLREDVVFVGGAVVGLLITDPAAPSVRPTKDVDCVVEVGSRVDYDTKVRPRLLAQGFAELQGEGVPLCAWTIDGIRLDVMTTEAEVLGFTNRWYTSAVRHASLYALGTVQIRLITPALFVATKLEAFYGRGAGDYLASHDIEDLITVVDGRSEILRDIARAPVDVRAYLQEELTRLLKTHAFRNALPGHLLDPGRESVVIARLKELRTAK